MDVAVSNRVVVRNGLGRFIEDCEQAGTMTAKKLVQKGARLSRSLAPVGSRPDPRTIPLKQSIKWRMVSSTAGVWGSSARHALHQEYGTTHHTMYGNPTFMFFWENAGRWWIPGLFGPQDIINHPGHEAANGGEGYLRPAYQIVMGQAMEVARQEYPG